MPTHQTDSSVSHRETLGKENRQSEQLTSTSHIPSASIEEIQAAWHRISVIRSSIAALECEWTSLAEFCWINGHFDTIAAHGNCAEPEYQHGISTTSLRYVGRPKTTAKSALNAYNFFLRTFRRPPDELLYTHGGHHPGWQAMYRLDSGKLIWIDTALMCVGVSLKASEGGAR